MPVLLNDILKIENLNNVKIRFNQSNKSDFVPLKLFNENKQRLMDGQYGNYSYKSYKEGEIAIGFAKIDNNKWLLFDISVITKDLNKLNAVGYEYQTLKEYENFFGRLIIEFHNKSQNMIRKANSVIDNCKVAKLLEDTFDNDIFPGYENVNITWDELKRVTTKSIWKTALENQKGVYLITDKLNGKMYVGAAYGEYMLLGRWLHYVKNGHGGNKELKNLEFEYIKENFKFSILDIFKSTIDDDIIIEREMWWKNTLQSRAFGYNSN
jgi:hypothetical protein